MLRLITALAVLANFAFAHETTIKKDLLAIDEIAGDYMGNGWSDVIELAEKPFNLKQQIAKLDKDVEAWRGCAMKMVVGRKKNIDKLYDPGVSWDKKLPNKIYALQKAGKIKAIVSKQWDEKTGDGVKCAVYSFRIFSTDGHVLRLHMELTD